MMRSATILLLLAQALAKGAAPKDPAENHITDTQAFADQFVSKFIDKLNDRLNNPDKKPEAEPATKDDDTSEFSDQFVDKLFTKLTQRLHEKLSEHAAAADDTTLDQYHASLANRANAYAPLAYGAQPGAQYDDYDQVVAEAAEAAEAAARAAKMAARAAHAAALAAEEAEYADAQPDQQQPGYDLAEEPETQYIVSIPTACLFGAVAGTITFFLTNKKPAKTEHEELLLA